MANCIFVRDEIMNWPFPALFLARPSSYSCKIQEFQENLNTCWFELREGSAGMGRQEGVTDPSRRELLVEQTEVLGAELSFILLN